MLSLLLAVAVSAPPVDEVQMRTDRAGRPLRAGGRAGSSPFAAFEFAPNGGAGMGAPCACVNPTGARGETITFTRGSSGTCLKSASQLTGIVAGDMATCSSNQARVMYGVAGANPTLGVLLEGTRTNATRQTENLDNVVWASDTTGGGSVTVTADQALSPLNTMTMERIQSGATTAGQSAVRYQLTACATGASALSFYVQGVSGSGTTDICITTASATFSCAPCAFVSGSISRCVHTATTTGGFGHAFIGNATLYNGGTARSASDFYAWGAQCENGDFATSYIATTGSAVARSADSSLRLSTLPAGITSGGSFAATLVPIWSTGAAGASPYLAYIDSNGRPAYSNVNNTVRAWDGANEPGAATTFTAFTAERIWSSWTGSTFTITTDATNTGSFDGTMGAATTVDFSRGGGAGTEVWGVLKLICLDPNPLRCR